MTTKREGSRKTSAASLVALVLVGVGFGLVRALAQDVPQPKPPVPVDRPVEPGIWVTEVDRDAETGQIQLLLNVGRDVGLERGDPLDVERDGKIIAHGSIVASYTDVSVAGIDQVEKGATVARGDWVRPRGKSVKRPAPVTQPNSVREVKDGRAVVDAGRNVGLRVGDEATVLRDGKPVARVKLEVVDDSSANGPIVEGTVTPGDRVEFTPSEHAHGTGQDPLEPGLSHEELRRLERDADTPKGIDFVATGFLGVVGELEHPMPFVAQCHIGVLVRRVIDGSPAEKAKIRPGDRVIGIDDRIVRTPSDIWRGIRRRAADFVRITIVRDDVIQNVSADFRKRY
jgi:hypothetical protein